LKKAERASLYFSSVRSHSALRSAVGSSSSGASLGAYQVLCSSPSRKARSSGPELSNS
jgi:hypothetical protein